MKIYKIIKTRIENIKFFYRTDEDNIVSPGNIESGETFFGSWTDDPKEFENDSSIQILVKEFESITELTSTINIFNSWLFDPEESPDDNDIERVIMGLDGNWRFDQDRYCKICGGICAEDCDYCFNCADALYEARKDEDERREELMKRYWANQAEKAEEAYKERQAAILEMEAAEEEDRKWREEKYRDNN